MVVPAHPRPLTAVAPSVHGVEDHASTPRGQSLAQVGIWIRRARRVGPEIVTYKSANFDTAILQCPQSRDRVVIDLSLRRIRKRTAGQRLAVKGQESPIGIIEANLIVAAIVG